MSRVMFWHGDIERDAVHRLLRNFRFVAETYGLVIPVSGTRRALADLSMLLALWAAAEVFVVGFSPPPSRTCAAMMDWEVQLSALMRALFEKGLMNVDEMRRGIEALPADEYETFSYFELWAASMETILTEKSVLTKEEIDDGVKSIEQRWG